MICIVSSDNPYIVTPQTHSPVMKHSPWNVEFPWRYLGQQNITTAVSPNSGLTHKHSLAPRGRKKERLMFTNNTHRAFIIAMNKIHFPTKYKFTDILQASRFFFFSNHSVIVKCVTSTCQSLYDQLILSHQSPYNIYSLFLLFRGFQGKGFLVILLT